MTLHSLWTVASSPEIHLLGWTLLHVVWQAALVAAVLAGVLHLLRDHGPHVRYAVSCVALITLLALPVGTALFLIEAVPTQGGTASLTVATEPADLEVLSEAARTDGALSSQTSWQAWASAWVQPVLPWLVFAWGAGVLIFAARLVGGAWRVRRLRRTSTAAPSTWQTSVQALAGQMRITRSVAVRLSTDLESPAVVGWWRPVVLVPAGLLSGLPPTHVEALLRHELAHIQRHDVLVGRIQALVEAVLFFHPATWWISRQVRETREVCCDQVAVRTGADRTEYARALANLAEQATSSGPAAWAPAASDGSLLSRIRQVLAPPPRPSERIQRLSTIVGVLLVLAVPIGLAACASQQSATEKDPTRSPAQAAADSRGAPDAQDETDSQIDRVPSAAARAMVVERDSMHASVRIESEGSMNADGLEEEVYVIRHGDRVDTIDVPNLDHIEPPFPPDSVERLLRGRINPDSLERALRIALDPDSLERAIRARIDVDSLERRALRMRLHADSVARWHKQHDDSLRRHLDRLRQQMEREVPEHLRERANRLREQAKRLEERAEQMEARDPPTRPAEPDSIG